MHETLGKLTGRALAPEDLTIDSSEMLIIKALPCFD
jgi:hypothetical protein